MLARTLIARWVMSDGSFEYDRAGVDTSRALSGLEILARSINETHRFRDESSFGRPAMGLGYYANVLALPGGQGLAIATDGVGTKIIVAELAGRYDTIPIDMIAMNVNDILCVGAEPFALVDYIAVGDIEDEIFEQLAAGLLEGARQSRVSIPGGEIAQVKELLRGHGTSTGLDLVGTAVGLVDWDRINLGASVQPGDVVIGLAASGLHSNGFTLARQVLLGTGGMALGDTPPGFDRKLSDILLEPTRIYVEPVMNLRDAGIEARALCHVTGDGFCNLNRIRAEVGFVLDGLPAADGVYRLIQETGEISDAEMYSVFNMGVGFCVVVAASDVEASLAALGEGASVIGHATDAHPKEVRLVGPGLIGGKDRLRPETA
jgi:phosphoribosylformylglycinamidine cyclo-ligase